MTDVSVTILPFRDTLQAMRLIRYTLKPRRPLLQPDTSPDRQAGRLQKTAYALSGLLLVCMLSLAAPLVAGELEEYPEVGPTPLLRSPVCINVTIVFNSGMVSLQGI